MNGNNQIFLQQKLFFGDLLFCWITDHNKSLQGLHCPPSDRFQFELPLPSCNVPVLQDWENLCSSPQATYHPIRVHILQP